ncbi:membrane hypothetical protein [Tenacibaculum litopenaei]|uniref:O-antigen polymerase n=1 Tax=Tenacibaculum litopenaei TaxID=396016 RepID=UPI0038941160
MLLGFLIYIFIFFRVFVKSKYNFFNPKVFILIVGLYYIFPVAFFNDVGDYNKYYLPLNSKEIDYWLLIIFTALFIGFYDVIASIHRKISGKSRKIKINTKLTNIWLWIGISFAIYFYFVFSTYGSFIQYFLTSRYDRYIDDQGMGAYMLLIYSLPFYFSFIYLVNRKAGKSNILTYIITALYILIFLALGERRIIVTTFLAYGYVLYSLKILKNKTIFVGIFLFIPIFTFLGDARNFRTDFSEVLEFSKERKIFDVKNLVSGENKAHYYIIDRTLNEEKEVLYGETYLSGLTALMPGWLIGERVDVYGMHFVKNYENSDGRAGAFLASSLLAEGIGNFGVLGVILGSLFLAVFVFFVFNYANVLPEEAKLVYESSLYPLLLIVFRADSGMLIQAFFIYSVLSIGVIFVNSLKKNVG